MESIDKEREKNRKSALLELDLVKVLEAIHESPETFRIPYRKREFFIDYCCKNKCPIDETLEFVNSRIKENMRMKKEEVIPESKKGKDFLIKMTLVSNLIKSGAIWDEQRKVDMIETYSEITGIERSIIDPIIATEIKKQRRRVIERDLYDFMREHVNKFEDAKSRKEVGEEIIRVFAEQLNVEPKYIKSVLKNKKKKDEAERKRIEEYRASQKAKCVVQPELDDDAR